MYRKTYAKINEEVLRQNVEEIVGKHPEYQYYFAVVKGNAYGHGMHIVNALIKGGANYLAVSSLEEAIAVREFNTEIPVLCLEPVSVEFLDEIIKQKVTITVDSLDYFKELLAANPDKKVRVHLKLDTGMNRLGIKSADELEAIFNADRGENVFIEGIYTHLATSGTNDVYYDKQIKNFKKITKNIDLSLVPIVHIGRSLTLVRHKKPDFVNGVRMGIIMYGFAQSMQKPSGIKGFKQQMLCKLKGISPVTFENDLKLKTAMALYSEVIAVKKVKKGEFIGYGATYKAKNDMCVATLPIGYFDGIEKSLEAVKIGGRDCRILGEVCMDMITVEANESIRVGDVAEVFGESVTIGRVAAKTGKSAYKVLTGITGRVARVYE